ncbi:F-box only protein 33 isoform X6 [Carettochelys insculpta]|uniref:F-box only protein 33 isoform X6 n=1 Tax=Carettochelys insculpta TaxID=44489 RepID=UPI003EBFBBE4
MLLFLSQEAQARPRPRPRPGSAAAGLGPVPGPGMAVCGEAVGAGSLPSELVVHIFSFLAGPDRLRASAACSHWRECLFYPALWPRLRLSLRVSPAERPRLDFLMRKCGWFVRELRVQFAADNYPSGGGGGVCEGAAAAAEGETPLCPRWLDLLRTYLELVLCVLSSVRNNRNLQKLSLFGDISILQQHGSISNTYLGKVDPDGKKIKQIQQLFEEILGNSRQLKWLSCGFMLQIVTPTSLSSLSNPIANTMEHLSLLDNHIPGYTVWAHNLIAIARLRGSDLKVLEVTEESIDFDQGELADQDVDPVHNLIEQATEEHLMEPFIIIPVFPLAGDSLKPCFMSCPTTGATATLGAAGGTTTCLLPSAGAPAWSRQRLPQLCCSGACGKQHIEHCGTKV